jgi:CTP:phosphocholine cytidylyltransferase-like protein/thiamine kinase-like enzyme
MNIQECDILNALLIEPYINQRILAEFCGHSLGIVNRSIKALIKEGYLDKEVQLTAKAMLEFKNKKPKNAIILAAGFGMRMIPINTETPKGMIEINGEPLIERLIKQLHAVDIKEIHIVVGFMKEQYEYLIDEYGVNLIVNSGYAIKNNLHSLNLVLDFLSNTYIIPCDIWCNCNPFNEYELYSWYMVNELVDSDSYVRVNRKMELISTPNTVVGNTMIGIAYLAEEQADIVRRRVRQMCKDTRYDGVFWEEALYKKDRMIVLARVIHSTEVIEINTYEQLRELDNNSNQLKSNAITTIAQVLQVDVEDVVDITMLKKGMTNRSFQFSCKGKKYIMRIPGEGTDHLINRAEEASVYQVIDGKGICDDIIYIDPLKGYKITKYLEGARVCDPLNVDDIKRCMEKLREFHELGLKVEHEFNIFKQIQFYESLWNGAPSVYKDYEKTKENVFSLKQYIDAHVDRKVLTHIDSVADNFLFIKDEHNTETIRLIDWEYAGMQDPHIDIAMFCIYSLYDKHEVDSLICAYFPEGCEDVVRIKIYCYISVCGLLWSNWCEYKRSLGVEFGEYSLRQYRFAKDYYRIVRDELERRGNR